jgi:hypothetical protein
LNGFLIAKLIDLKAVQAFDGVRHMFASDCVELSCAVDLEEAEINLRLRTQRSTPKRTFVEMQGYENPPEPFNVELNDEEGFFKVIENCLMLYNGDDFILDISEPDGFFAALVCATITIMPSVWVSAIWGGEHLVPQWESEQEITEFNQSIMPHYNVVMSDLTGRSMSHYFWMAFTDF